MGHCIQICRERVETGAWHPVNVGRTGAVTPVAELAPVEISGTTVKRASLFSWDEVAQLDVRVGDRVRVEKAGEIIPQVIEVVQPARQRTQPVMAAHLSQLWDRPCPQPGRGRLAL